MREIKYRGQGVDTKEWVYGLPLYEVIGGAIYITKIQSINNLCFYEIVPETLGQYTGIDDKNGKEIYEDDIVVNKDKFSNVIGQIIFGKIPEDRTSGGHQGFYIKWENDNSNCWDDWWRHDLYYWIGKIEVIGNIHNNPELLHEVSL